MLLRFVISILITYIGGLNSLASQKSPLEMLIDEQRNVESRLGPRLMIMDLQNELTKFVSPMEYRGPPSPDNTTFDYGALKFELQPDSKDDRDLKITYDEKKEYLKGGRYYRENSLQLTDLLLTNAKGKVEFQCFYEVDLNVSEGKRVLLTFSALLPSNVDLSTVRLISHDSASTQLFKIKNGNVLTDPAALDADTIQVVPANTQTILAFSAKRSSSAGISSSSSETATLMSEQSDSSNREE